MLSLADAQLITGISILVSGFWSLKHGPGLTAYHWQMVVSLAWFSTVTHLSALTFLRSYLAKHPAGRLWRLALMFILLVLLFVAFIPTGHFNFVDDDTGSPRTIDLGQTIYPTDCDDFQLAEPRYYHTLLSSLNLTYDPELLINGTIGPRNCTVSGMPVFQFNITRDELALGEQVYFSIKDWPWNEVGIFLASPAACFFKDFTGKPTLAFVSMISSLLLLAYSYLIRAAKVFAGPSRMISQRTQSALDRGYDALIDKWDRCLTRRKRGGLVVLGLVFLPIQASVYCTLRVFLHLYTSMFAEVTN